MSHKAYQDLIEKYQTQQKDLNEKHRVEKATMENLIYELRFKRK